MLRINFWYLQPNINKIGRLVVSFITPLQFAKYSSSLLFIELALSPKPHLAMVSKVSLCSKLKRIKKIKNYDNLYMAWAENHESLKKAFQVF